MQEVLDAEVKVCPRRGCRADATVDAVRRGVIMFMMCEPHRDEIEADQWAGWVVNLAPRRRPFLEVYRKGEPRELDLRGEGG